MNTNKYAIHSRLKVYRPHLLQKIGKGCCMVQMETAQKVNISFKKNL